MTNRTFSLYDLSTIALAIEHQRDLARDEYNERLRHLDKLSRIVRQCIDEYTTEKKAELEERGFFDEAPEEPECDFE